MVHLADKQGVCKPPLRGPADEQLDDPFVLSYRRGLAVVARGSSGGQEGEGTAPGQLAVVESTSGRQVAAFRPMQRVWVQLSADGSRVHGPSLRMRLLADSHPAAVEAAQREAAAEASSSSSVAGAAGAARAVYRPPGVGKPAPPPGFENRDTNAAAGHAAATTPSSAQQSQAAALGATTAAIGASSSSSSSAATGAPAEPASLARQLQAALEQAGAAMEDGNSLAWQAAVPAVDQLAAASNSCNSAAGDGARSAAASDSSAAKQALAQALRRLQAQAARLQLRAGAAPPGRPRTERWAQAAAAAQRELAVVQQLMPG